ncbi:PucR family transcriptional regulator [Labedaea rhizosphaerae]|uniref:DNA-binding PucR family transcriptional regulator n=1 Tax=Labedaea rhizosphaerae TaxID=598644 RepID=A0A4R6SI72_LABRH|nr:helix-turn-helix domain-containing protein [Labedaea rhizosphaerae]TDQ01363.1 DNA-binding PucR family transcriptional regulator [Labedaea rhizosphaerae]
MRVARELALRMPQIVKNAVERVIDDMPRHASNVEVRKTVALHLDWAVRALGPGVEPDLTPLRVTARQNAAAEVPLPDVLHLHRIALTELWQQVVDITATGRPDDTAELVATAGMLWRLLDRFADVVAEAYRDATADSLRTRREPLLDALFAGGAALDGNLWDIARVLGLAVDGDYVVVAAEAPALGREPLPDIETRLTEAHIASAWRDSPERRVGVVSVRQEGALDVLLDLLRRNDSTRIGVSPGYRGLDNSAKALHLALVALGSMAPGAVGVVRFGESPLAGLVASAPETSVRLAQQVLRPILALPGEDRQVLLATLRAWFDCQGSAKLTADRMSCHANTIRYRLKRIAAELGRSLADPADVAEIGAALRALQAFPDQGPRRLIT